MKITTDYLGGIYVIMNRGRVIARYRICREFALACDSLDRLQEQLKRPEAFCDCQDICTKGKR